MLVEKKHNGSGPSAETAGTAPRQDPRPPEASVLPNSLWAATAEAAPETKPLTGTEEVDSVVIGAGFTGLRAALLLAEAGQRVTVLDARTIGWGASGRNGGQVNPLPPAHGPDKIVSLIGASAFERYAEAALGSADELFAIIARHDIACQARQKGWLRVDHCQSAMRNARRIAEAWNRHGAEIAFLDGPDLHRELGSTAFETGTLIEKGGAIHPLSYVRGLARCAMAAGVAVHSDSPAVALERHDPHWEVRSPSGIVRANAVLLCANGYTDQLWPRLAETIIPLVSIQAATEPLSPSDAESILPKGRTVADTRREIFYGRREPNNRILLGSLGRLTERGDRAAFRALQEEAERIFPMLTNTRWAFRWSGRIAVTQDHLPHLHEPAPGIFAGLGYNGRGVAMSNVMGRALAERVLGKAPDAVPFPVRPIRPYPLHRFHEIGARALMWWMRTRDRSEAAHR